MLDRVYFSGQKERELSVGALAVMNRSLSDKLQTHWNAQTLPNWETIKWFAFRVWWFPDGFFYWHD